MGDKLTTTLFVPALNEVDGLKAIMPKIDPSWFDQIIIADGNSQDGSVEYAESQGYEVMVQSQKGIRHAYIEGFPMIRGDIVVTFSPDGNCIPEHIPALIEKIKEGYDMVVASRYKDEAKSDDDDIVTGFGNYMFNFIIKLLHGYPYTDCMGIFRAYRTNVFYELGLDKEESYWQEQLYATKIGIEPLLSIRAAKMKMKIGEIPADEPPRIFGERKLQIFRWGASYLTQMITEFFSRKYRRK
ncbi:MAG: glycosyltransferase [Candidatus Nitrohelix vancouverensis]|uniref:Glycosyltransferase n=1 Tax=Candidatus Nitrohelix vancouverensis TaxID=2705534 RepID=A0A7T0C2E0_9BACT|nr:MAG: glycosyltransferase [Candidatus Nitrohelix vancouverensis]